MKLVKCKIRPKNIHETSLIRLYYRTPGGGVHVGSDTDEVIPYIKSVLGLMGITDVKSVYAEGLDMGSEAAEKSLHHARP